MTPPNFRIIGAAKSGTAVLCHYLGQHPRARTSPLKDQNLSPEKIQVVPVAADGIFHEPVSHSQLKHVRNEYLLADRFIYYPAQLWPHKNHVGLIRVLAGLRRNNHLEIPLVLTGSRQTGYPAIAQEITAQGLSRQVLFLEAIPFERLPAIYRLCYGVILPSLYEGSNFPILEAFATGTPVIASNIRPVRELIGDEDFLFDPRNEEKMAEKIRRLWVDTSFYEQAKSYSLSQRGKYSWKELAAKMLEVYREAALTPFPPHHDEASIKRAFDARVEVIDDLRRRLAETEKALEESERGRTAKEQVIQELKENTRVLMQELGAIRSGWGYRASTWFRKTFRGG